MVIVADKKRPFADWGATLTGIAGGNTVPAYAAKRDIFTKQTESVMTPQTQKSPLKVVSANTKGKPTFATAKGMTPPIDWAAFLAGISHGKTVLEYGAGRTIFVQGDPADSIWYLHHGKVKLAVTSQQGKEAIVTVLSDNEFFGEGCLAVRPSRVAQKSGYPSLPGPIVRWQLHRG